MRCTARCLSASTHSLPQVTSAGRNLITVFSTVNNLAGEIASPLGRSSVTEPAFASHRCRRCLRHTMRCVREGLQKSALFPLFPRTAPTTRTCATQRAPRPRACRNHGRQASGTGQKNFLRRVPVCASQQAGCAKLREPGRRTARPGSGVRRHAQRPSGAARRPRREHDRANARCLRTKKNRPRGRFFFRRGRPVSGPRPRAARRSRRARAVR